MLVDSVRTATIFGALVQKGECELDELALACPQLGWHQIFLEVDRLSREGRVRLVARGSGIYVAILLHRDDGRTACTEEGSLETGYERRYAGDRWTG